jgi:hypothetical protein
MVELGCLLDSAGFQNFEKNIFTWVSKCQGVTHFKSVYIQRWFSHTSFQKLASFRLVFFLNKKLKKSSKILYAHNFIMFK